MSNYILDTNTCIYWLKGREEIRRKIEEVGTDNLRITIITLAELRFGAYNSKKIEDNLRNIDNFLKKIPIIYLSENAADKFGKIKVDLRKSGKVIDDNDILVTNNTEHFKRIEGLTFENWIQN